MTPEPKCNKRHDKRHGRKDPKKKIIRPWLRDPRSVVAVGTLAAYTAFGGGIEPRMYAMEGSGAWEAGVRSQDRPRETPVRRFDIPAGPLDTVLQAYHAIAGLRVVIPIEGIRDLQSPGVAGNFTEEQALKQLLAGTGASYRYTGPETVTLEVRGVTESMTVTGGSAPLAGIKYTEPQRDIPQTITVISKTLIEEQGATTLRDVLRNVPGLTVAAGEGGAPAGDNLTLRGFSARNDIFVDGVRDLSPQSRDPFNLEQVEVVKGPGSAYSGRGSAGGSINMINKSPLPSRFFGGTVQFGTDGTKRFTTDINQPINDRTAFRMNGLFHKSGVAGRDVVDYQRWGMAPSISFGLGTPTRITASYYHLQQDNLSDYGIPWVPATNNALAAYRDKPAPVPRDTFYGLKNRDFEEMRAQSGTIRFEHDFSDALVLRNQFRYSHASRDSIATPPRFANNNSTAINRELRSWVTIDGMYDNQTDVKSAFKTGGIDHSLVTGMQLSRENNIRKTRTAPNSPTTLLDPNPNDTYTGIITTSPLVGNVTGDSMALYAYDTIRLAKKWELSGGLRWDYFGVDGVSTTLVPVRRVDRMVSWRAGLLYKPVETASVYFSSGTSLSPSLEGLSYGTANTAIDPEKTYTLEVGTKWDLFKERLSLSGAIFKVEKTNARTPGLLPDDPPQVLQGTQRVQGVELGASGNITRDLKVLAAYSLLDGEIVKSNTPAERGRVIQNTPRNSFSIWSFYQLPWRRVALGGGPRYVGRRFGNNINTRQVDGYWQLDAMASFPVTHQIDLRINGYNLTNEYYFDRLGGGHIIPGPGRSVALSTNFRF